MSRSVLRAEIGEQPDVLARLLVREGPRIRRIARDLAQPQFEAVSRQSAARQLACNRQKCRCNRRRRHR